MLCTSDFEGLVRNNQMTVSQEKAQQSPPAAVSTRPLMRRLGKPSARHPLQTARGHLKQTNLALLPTHEHRDDNFTPVPRRGRAACPPAAAVSALHSPPTPPQPPPRRPFHRTRAILPPAPRSLSGQGRGSPAAFLRGEAGNRAPPPRIGRKPAPPQGPGPTRAAAASPGTF